MTNKGTNVKSYVFMLFFFRCHYSLMCQIFSFGTVQPYLAGHYVERVEFLVCNDVATSFCSLLYNKQNTLIKQSN